MKIFYKFISLFLFKNKYQRKNFYQGISRVGPLKYWHLTKIISSEVAQNKKFKYNVSIVAIAKNEGIYFKEWIEYHKLIGIEHFYIYNNESTDNTKEVLAPYIREGLVTFTDFPGKEKQGAAYNDAIAHYKEETKWMCNLDLDEFICLKKHNNINEFMEGFKDCFQISLRWVYYGSSGHVKQPKGLVIKNFNHRAKECVVTPKSIFNPRVALDAVPVHYVIGVGKWVDEYHMPYGEKYATVDIAQINHYFIKSKEEFINRKIARGTCYQKLEYVDIESTFAKFDLNEVEDNFMLKYADKL